MLKNINLNVNGDDYNLAVRPNETLQDLLRDRLGLTGTKKGCELGVCGACTVLIDDEPMNSCIVLAVSVHGKRITTIEGLAKHGNLHPLQASFIHHGAVQCGYCTPGMLMNAKALIDKNPGPSEEDIKRALGGNLCRCTGYVKIIEAIKGWKDFSDDKKITGAGSGHPAPSANFSSLIWRLVRHGALAPHQPSSLSLAWDRACPARTRPIK
jgi:carbon-monoxide dehydrogenase small subunit